MHVQSRAKESVVKSGIELARIQKALEVAYELFCVLTFERQYSLEVFQYLPSNVKDNQTDVDKLLNSVARRSYWLREFENDLLIERRQTKIEALTKNERETLEVWRERLGMTDV